MLASGEDDVFRAVERSSPTTSAITSRPTLRWLDAAATALGLAVPPGTEPLDYEGLTDRYLSDQMRTARTMRQHTHYAISAAPRLRGGCHAYPAVPGHSWCQMAFPIRFELENGLARRLPAVPGEAPEALS